MQWKKYSVNLISFYKEYFTQPDTHSDIKEQCIFFMDKQSQEHYRFKTKIKRSRGDALRWKKMPQTQQILQKYEMKFYDNVSQC